MLIKDLQITDDLVTDFVSTVLNECDDKVKEWYSNPKRLSRYSHATSLIVDNRIVSISFCNEYNNWWRVGQLHYTLKEYRKQYPSAMLRKDGFLDHHFKTANNSGIFFSIHTYNNRMKVQSEMMHGRLINHFRQQLTPLRNQVQFLGEHMLASVLQDIFVFPKKQFNKLTFLEDLEHANLKIIQTNPNRHN